MGVTSSLSGPQVLPGLVSATDAEVRRTAYPVHHNCDECVKRSDASHFILFVLVSLLVYNNNGLHLFSQWKSGDQEVAGEATDRGRGDGKESCRHKLSCFHAALFLLLFFGGGWGSVGLPGGVKHCNSLTRTYSLTRTHKKGILPAHGHTRLRP